MCYLPNHVTWNGTWSGVPNSSTEVIIDAPYNTGIGGSQVSFNACSLTVNSTLTVANGTFIEVENDVNVSGEIYVETQGAFVQRDDVGTFNLISPGIASVNKQTAPKDKWYFYTYWSSPVESETIGNVFPDVDGDRRFWFKADNFADSNGDDIDDNNNDWQYAFAADPLVPGVGYAITEAPLFPGGGASGTATFTGTFNTGNIPVNITFDPSNTGLKWNFIGNPYPSAIDFEAFFAANSGLIDGFAYLWSQASPPSSLYLGNQQLNFNLNDYAVYAAGIGGTMGGAGVEPTQYIPTGQGFFIPANTIGTATFTNAMRVNGATDNNLFFKNTNSKGKSNTVADSNKLWVNLTSDNGVFGQILIGYVEGATDGYDLRAYDAPRASSETPAILYWNIENSTKKFAIQGKAANSINEDETIQLGFKTTINVATLYTLSIAKLQGDFLTNSPIYLVDKLLNKTHDLSVCDYTFTSEVGEFNSRFEIAFTNKTLADASFTSNANSVKITSLDKNSVSFKASNNLNISQVSIFDVLGRTLYTFKGKSNEETFSYSNLNQTVFIAKITLSNGAVITKKAVLK